LPERRHKDADLLVLGRAIRGMREQQDMSADELAVATGMNRRRIDALETGRLDPTYELLLALADGLGIQPSALVTLAEQLKQSNEP
jgi:transcriptional regulator with XRE-family HTH domain